MTILASSSLPPAPDLFCGNGYFNVSGRGRPDRSRLSPRRVLILVENADRDEHGSRRKNYRKPLQKTPKNSPPNHAGEAERPSDHDINGQYRYEYRNFVRCQI